MLLRGKKRYRSDTQQTKLPAHQSSMVYCRIPPQAAFCPCDDDDGDGDGDDDDDDLTAASLHAAFPYSHLRTIGNGSP